MCKNLIIALFALMSHQVMAQSDAIKTAEIKTNIYCDHCQECPDCGKNIFMNVKGNKGVKSVNVDDVKEVITVAYDSKKITLEEIEASIAMAGFDANDRKADPEAYQKLDGCCKKP